jgi:CRISPR-associated endonuclease Csn1
VSVFPRGVEERDDKRGAPKNQARREARHQRRTVARRGQRRRLLRRRLIAEGLYPSPGEPFDHDFFKQTPWEIRRDGLQRALTPHEFGRALIHLNQRRGASGVNVDDEEEAEAGKVKEEKDSEQKVKEAISRLGGVIGNRTFGQFMADLYDQRKRAALDRDGHEKRTHFRAAIRNRRDAFEFHATRKMVREEFHCLWQAQRKLGGAVARVLTDELRTVFDDPTEDGVWREKGVIFGQRRTYWKGRVRCDLEPGDHRCPLADMYAQEYRILETLNNIRVKWGDQAWRPLDEAERAKVAAKLRSQKSANPKTIRTALGIKKSQEAFFSLNFDADPDREINTDWFYREIVSPVFGVDAWEKMSEREKDSVNRAILKFDPDKTEHADRLRAGARKWWGVSEDKTENLIKSWKGRPKLEKRLKLSRRAIQNLLPLMRRQDSRAGTWPTETEARQRFAEDPSNAATPEQRARYAFNITDTLRSLLARLVGVERAKGLLRLRGTNKRDRHYLRKHPDRLLPPAPMLANPVVRKAIHEVRRHLIAWMKKFGCKPDRVVIEMVREARQSAKVRNSILARNRSREKDRKKIGGDLNLHGSSSRQQDAVDRVLLCRQQRGVCAYTGEPISEQRAAEGTDVELDHIVPKSLCWDNGLNNKVLCYRNANRGKGQRTPKNWLSQEGYAAMLQRLHFLEKDKPEKGGYFSKKDCARKWDNLTSETPSVADFLESQYTDTAYAARQVVQWLNGVLYGDEEDGHRRVFTTKGKYTSILRKDWQLQDSDGPKERSDHRHHAVDALIIALSGPERIQELAARAADQERFHETHGQWSRRDPVDPPWGAVKEFRAAVLGKVQRLIVAHRPVKRKVVGRLHLDTAYGKALEYPGLYSFKMSAQELKPSHLRAPREKVAKKGGATTYSIQGSGRGGGQGSVVRSPGLRKAIRRCLHKNDIRPDDFTEKEIKALTDRADYKLRFQSGVPIYDVTMVRTLTDPIAILRQHGDGVERYYVGGNNHHVEILEDTKTGKWCLDRVDMFTAANRAHPPRTEKRQPLVDREDRHGKRFIMSLSEGETLFLKSPNMERTKVEEYDYFVVAKIDEQIHLIHHTDARPAAARKSPQTGDLDEPRELVSLPASRLKALCLPSGEPPRKVRVRLPGYKDFPGAVQFLKND